MPRRPENTESAAKHRAAVTKRKRALAQWIAEYKEHCFCSRCGESHPACLQFHHRNPREKDFSIGNAAGWGWSLERIQHEISKCDVLCANCHAKVHWEERQARKQAPAA